MERFAIEEMKKWKESSNRKPLVIMGARQVGKTWLMKEFGRKYYKNTAYISFYNNSDMKNLFDSDYDIKRILPYMKNLVGLDMDSCGVSEPSKNPMKSRVSGIGGCVEHV